MKDDELTKLQVEAWKTTVQVQQHFNEIEMKIRALAITVLTAGVGAGAVAIRDGTTLLVFGQTVRLGAIILLISLLAWMLFYIVDQVWYHRLLLGAVKHGEELEKILTDANVLGFELSTAISEASPYQARFFGRDVWKPIHSSAKLRIFYWGVASILLLAVALAQFGGLDASTKKTTSSRASAWQRASSSPANTPSSKAAVGQKLSTPAR